MHLIAHIAFVAVQVVDLTANRFFESDLRFGFAIFALSPFRFGIVQCEH